MLGKIIVVLVALSVLQVLLSLAITHAFVAVLGAGAVALWFRAVRKSSHA